MRIAPNAKCQRVLVLAVWLVVVVDDADDDDNDDDDDDDVDNDVDGCVGLQCRVRVASLESTESTGVMDIPVSQARRSGLATIYYNSTIVHS